MSLNFVLYVTLNKRFLRTLMCSRVALGGANGGAGGGRAGGVRGARSEAETWLAMGETAFTPSHNTHVQLLLPAARRDNSPSRSASRAQAHLQSILRSRL